MTNHLNVDETGPVHTLRPHKEGTNSLFPFHFHSSHSAARSMNSCCCCRESVLTRPPPLSYFTPLPGQAIVGWWGAGGPNVFEDSLNVMMMVDGWWWWRWDNWGLQSVGWGGCDGSFFPLVKAGLDVLQNRRIRLSQFRGRSQLQSKKKKTSVGWKT